MLADGGTLSYVEAALGYKRAERMLFSNLPQLVFGGHNGDGSAGGNAIMHFPDVPVLATLLGANLRRGRNVQEMDKASRAPGVGGDPAPDRGGRTRPHHGWARRRSSPTIR